MNSIGARCTVARSSLLIAACALLAGCMQMSESECRAADWYHLGYRDADSYGLRPQVDQYAHLCRAFGVQAAESTYLAGWWTDIASGIPGSWGASAAAPTERGALKHGLGP
jgi:hypothetical protein